MRAWTLRNLIGDGMTEAREKIEKVLTLLNVPGRTLWSKADIEGAIDDLLDVWGMLLSQEETTNENA